jgi:Transglycosylase
VTADDVLVAGQVISVDPLGPFRASAEGELTWDAATRRAAFREGVLSIGDALRVDVEGEARAGPGVPYAVALRARDVDYAAAIEALPPALRPPEAAPHPHGTLDARFDASGPLLSPSAWTLEAALDLSRMRAASRGDPDAVLRRPFVYEPESTSGEVRPFEVGPRNPAFVPVADLPAYVIRAVTTSEDAGFFAHHGFDFAELANAFSEGAELGRVVRGGSTITQQLAKNLYLSREKTIARKVREAAITIALEATVPKARLLEIYLNVAEWGPGVYGIGAAAQHWFGKDARALSPKEAAFLASIIPNPVRYHYMRARGALSDTWEQRVHDILLRMSEQGTLTTDELLRALAEPIVFAGG